MKTSGKIWIFFDQQKGKQTKPMSTTQAQMLLLSIQDRDLNRYTIWTPGWDEWTPVSQFLKTDQTFFVMAPAHNHPPIQEVTNTFDELTKTKSFPNPNSDEESADISDQHTYTLKAKHEESAEEEAFTRVSFEGPSSREDFGYYYQDFNGDELKVHHATSHKKNTKKSAKSNERRDSTRHKFKIEIILIAKNGRSFRTHSKNISLGGTLLEDEIPKEFRSMDLDMVIVNKFDHDFKTGRLHFKGKIVGDLEDPRRLTFVEPSPEMCARLDALLKSYMNYRQHIKKKSA